MTGIAYRSFLAVVDGAADLIFGDAAATSCAELNGLAVPLATMERLDNRGKPLSLAARAFVLATGKRGEGEGGADGAAGWRLQASTADRP